MPTNEVLIEIIPAIRAILTRSGISPVIRFTDSEPVKKTGKSKTKFENGLNGIPGCYINDTAPDQIVQSFRAIHTDSNFTYGVVYVKDLGLLSVGNTMEESNHFMNELTKGSTAATPVETEKKGRVHNKIFIITGGAMGFGKGIAEEMVAEGGYVVIADINPEAARSTASEINGKTGNTRALAVSCDVTDPASVSRMVAETVLEFGGLDVLVSNAGVLKAGSLEDFDEKTFDFVTGVNYKGFFTCTKYCVPVMKTQHRHNPSMYMDIIQVNSKSGLSGSNRNFAYSGSKFGSIGLVQSFALELASSNIKVNAICPGNYFEGPLWSDPASGLFAQYLKAGKVPGAKNIAEVRKHYESLVPMGRGCLPGDIVKTIYYLIEQEYETGQAIPVTGGQVMLN